MTSRRRIPNRAGWSPLLLLLAACGGTMAVRTPPPSSAEPQVAELLVASCYPCHASDAAMPWYGRLAPSTWPRSAYTVLDFAQWATYEPVRRAATLNAIAAAVDGRSMPPSDYTLLDHQARLTEDQRHLLAGWASAEAAAIRTR